jgi:hypothetical protein
MKVRSVCLAAAVVCVQLAAQSRRVPLDPTFGPGRLVSPDGAYALFGSETAPELWVEDTRTHGRRMVFRVTLQTLSLAWSPDSAAFIANDRAVSDMEIAYIYDVKTLDRLDLRARLVAADPDAVRFFVPGQVRPAPAEPPRGKVPSMSYVEALHWIDSTHVEVALYGHTVGERVRNSIEPGNCFDLRYRIARDGAVQKLSQHVSPITSQGCEAVE